MTVLDKKELQMSVGDIEIVIQRLDRLESKVDVLNVQYQRHEAESRERDVISGETRRFLLTVLSGVMIAAMVSAGAFTLGVYKLLP